MSACKMVKVCHISSAHPPFDTRILYKFSSTLARAGYDTVLIIPHEKPEQVNRVRIRPVKKPRRRWERVLCTGWRICRAALQEKACIYHFHDPELIGVGLILKLRGKRVIYDVHEDLPQQVLNKYWIPVCLRRLVGRLAGFIELLGARFFDGITAATPAIARRFPPGKTVTVQNFPLSDELIQDNALPYEQRPPIIAYVGNIAEGRGAREMIEAVGLLTGSPGLQLRLAGMLVPAGYEPGLRRLKGWERVNYLGWQDRGGIKRLLSESRVGLVVLHPLPNYLESYPIKLFEYMSAGLPVIASDFPLWREIVSGAECGLLVDPLDPQAIAGALRWILEHPREAGDMGTRGREAVRGRYNWETEGKKMIRLYRKLTGDKEG